MTCPLLPEIVWTRRAHLFGSRPAKWTTPLPLGWSYRLQNFLSPYEHRTPDGQLQPTEDIPSEKTPRSQSSLSLPALLTLASNGEPLLLGQIARQKTARLSSITPESHPSGTPTLPPNLTVLLESLNTKPLPPCNAFELVPKRSVTSFRLPA